jgi:predicted small lipoprotein YifL
MRTEIRKFVATVSALGQLASCAETGPLEVTNGNTSVSAQNTTTYVPNNVIAGADESQLKEQLAKRLWSPCGRCCLARRELSHTVNPSPD